VQILNAKHNHNIFLCSAAVCNEKKGRNHFSKNIKKLVADLSGG